MRARADDALSCKRGGVAVVALGVLLVAYRVACALCMRTSFVPDEYWQANEVAHWMAFGYGYRTWEWQQALRGFFHPGIFAILFSILKCLGMDSSDAIAVAPRILQAVFVGIADLCVARLAAKWFGRAAGHMTLLASVSSWFIAYCGPRTLSSSMEAALVPIALDLMTNGSRVVVHSQQALFGWILAAASCLVRPTAAILWMCVGAVHLMQASHWKATLVRLSPIVIGAALVSLVVDRWWYGFWTIVQLNFLRFNVLTGGASFYGTHPWSWYWFQGLPVVLGVLYVVLPIGLILLQRNGVRTRPLWPLVVACVYVLVFSQLPHKEFRFVFPVIYLVLPHAGLILKHWRKHARVVVWTALVINIPVIVYTLRVHQAGPEAVMHYLRHQHTLYGETTIQFSTSSTTQPHQLSVLFLTDCHPTPFYSYMHRNVTMVFAECPPPSLGPNESDALHADPLAWLNATFPPPSATPSPPFPTAPHVGAQSPTLWSLPRFIVAYADVLGVQARPWLEQHDYRPVYCVDHAHFPQSDRDGRIMCVYTRAQQTAPAKARAGNAETHVWVEL